MKKFKKIAAAAASLAVIATSMTAFASSTQKRPRDASGDGEVRLNDAIFTRFYLQGMYNPTNIKAFDFDGNGIISWMDVDKINHYILDNLRKSDYEEYINEYTPAYATTREYVRHYYNNSVSNPVTQYSLTVDPLNNTHSASNASSQQRVIIGENDMILDSETAVVQLSNGGSGFIVGKHVIATAAHNVYKNGQFHFLQVKLTDRDNNSQIITPQYSDINKIFFDNYTSPIEYPHSCYINDYALIYVNEDLSQYGSLNMGVALDEYIDKHGEVIVSGFPRSDGYPKQFQGLGNGLRFLAKGKILDTNSNDAPYILTYDADAFNGDSGGPVYAQEAFITASVNHPVTYTYNTVIAIHIADNKNALLNFGLRITPDILNFYYNNSNVD